MSSAPSAELATALAPVVAPLPPLADDDVFTPEQWTTLFALLEVFAPSVRPAGDSDGDALQCSDYEKLIEEIQQYAPKGLAREDIEAYMAESIDSLPGLKEDLRRRFLCTVPKDGRAGLTSILNALNTTAGSLLMTGSTTPIHQQSITDRTTIIRKWSQSYLPLFRKLHNTFSGLSKMTYIYQSDKFYKVIGYPGTHAGAMRRPTYDFKFKDFSAADAPTTLTADVVVVGSGPGAGALTNRLAKAGLKCIVLEKGYHHNSDHFPMKHGDAGVHLYENGGSIITDDGSLGTAAGSTLGGGGTVNWAASLQTPESVREEWRKDHGLPFATSSAFQESLDFVCDKMGVAKMNDHEALANIKHSSPNQFLLEGARKCGMEARVVPQNMGGETHDCGHCHMGCPSCTKRGPANLWLPEAAEAGTEFVQGCWAEKILFADDKKTAVGVEGVWTSPDRQTTRKITVHAQRVVVSSGSFHSPLLLQRSGLTNPLIGKNLRLHPVFYVYAVMPERVDPWQGGGILTAMVTALKHGTGDGYGPLMEICGGFPTLTGSSIPYSNNVVGGGAAEFKANLAKLGHTIPILLITRDKTTGEVYADKHNQQMVHIKYSPNQADRDQLANAQLAAAKISYEMGAKEIHACHPNIEPFVRSAKASEETNDEGFRAWLEEVKTKGIAANSEPLLFHSAHQFGTCQMSGTSDRGVVDGKGRVWGYNNLWVADSSVLPTPTGVNPMISTMGTADWIARGIEKEWKEKQ